MLSKRLKELRMKHQLTQVALADKLGISNGLYNKYKKKDRPHYMDGLILPHRRKPCKERC